MHILSPFDPLIIQRKRLQLFFDYEHRFEAYLPKEKRVFGYLALPVLVGDEIVAAIDLKTDRANRKLLIQKWTWVGAARTRSAQAADRGGAAPVRAVPAALISASAAAWNALTRLVPRKMPHCRPKEALPGDQGAAWLQQPAGASRKSGFRWR